MITISNNKIEIRKYNDKTNEWDNDLVSIVDFSTYYNEPITLSSDLTIGGFMAALKPFYSIIDEHFYSYNRGYKLIEYYKWMNEPVTKLNWEDTDVISHIEMYWSADIHDYTDDVTSVSTTDFSFYGGFHGVSTIDETKYSMSLTGINEYKGFIFKLNNKFTISHGGEDTNGEYFNKNLITTTKQWDFYSLIRYFFYDLTFGGYKEDVEKEKKSMDHTMSKLDSGDETTRNIEYFLLEISEKNLEEALAIENYKGAEKIQNKINKLKLKIKEIENE